MENHPVNRMITRNLKSARFVKWEDKTLEQARLGKLELDLLMDFDYQLAKSEEDNSYLLAYNWNVQLICEQNGILFDAQYQVIYQVGYRPGATTLDDLMQLLEDFLIKVQLAWKNRIADTHLGGVYLSHYAPTVFQDRIEELYEEVLPEQNLR